MKLKGTFFIASLPRTRTAWLANWLTCGDSTCHHEALRFCASGAEIKKYFEATGAPYVGDSDSGLPFMIDEVMGEFPEARLVVIERPVEPVLLSLAKTFSAAKASFQEVVTKTNLALERMKKKYRPLVIPYDALNDQKTCERIWAHCLPEIPFNELRWKMLDQLVVEIQPEKYLKTFPPEAAQRWIALIKNYQ